MLECNPMSLRASVPERPIGIEHVGPSHALMTRETRSDALGALAAVEEQLCGVRRSNQRLRMSNARLMQALAAAKVRETEARRLAHHDDLTGLPNRLLLGQRLRHEIEQAFQGKRQLALLFIDIDGFKTVNDRLGHAAGDKLLTLVASRITACVRADDIVCRYGGDEFVVLLPGIQDAAIAAAIVETIRERIDGHYEAGDQGIHISASIGLALYPTDGEHCDALLDCADAAMYRSKDACVRRPG